MYGYTSWYHSLRLVTCQISITSVWVQSAILPTYNHLCSVPSSNLHLSECRHSKIGIPIPHSILKNMQRYEYCTSSRKLVLKRFIKNERRAICIALWRISSSVSGIDSKVSHNPPNNITTLYQNFVVKIFSWKFSPSHNKREETSECKKIVT
jgi:hypothetical protein